ncbi:DJ-1/PfpI family protein [Companilactobacillus sp.]|jgi:4-methyl-5(b-hydroxyethyl)-thiazole monophosphate biosynthesis|uniref:DJ-1/PfpI family protein n=1 Tax=Companilactobacillus sp. TaxID=2767905 RepID=UPI0025BA145D|nr:DJ-1/PfpI family protein [Companilactobacillus sp.]MCH4008526.1 DJ-1/PfpI family protein [Companilactobacillus sp.]MCH4051295.1 DJ-1/PfpI family protein [Companilactobacillus sp.]MCH4076469.1 DJ-1/PfpI family protein [Companilactobacillus sp.]MCH4125044.1 DJ-1/PfpI family protein [Companilactobacillus sp.]MCH4131585.1 DJ-1/PfpI family protein [Companilactobacillus sp.]
MSKTLLLLADGFEAYEASVFTDVLGWNLFEGDKSTELVSVGMQPTLRCTWGYSVVPDQQLDNIDLNDFDALAIPGGFAEANFYDNAFSQTFGDVIQYFDQANKPIASICVAALALGHSGILKNRPATTYSFPGNIRQDQLAQMGVKVDRSADTVIDKNVITSSSPATALTVAYWLLEQLTDSKNVKNVKQRMGFRNQESK